MTICIVWLLTYVGQVLDLAVENRPMSVAHARHGQDYHHEVGGIRKHQNELGSIAGNLLHLKTYPYEGSHHRDDLSEWLVYNEKQPIYSWTPSGMLVDEIMKEPKDLQAVFLALSPGLSNVLYPEYVTVTSPYVSVSSMSRTTSEPLVDDALLAEHQHRYQRQHQQRQPYQHQHEQQRQLHQRNKKRRVIDYGNNKHQAATENRAVGLPILIYDNGEKILPDGRQSDREDVYEQRLNSSPIKSKTEPIYERVSKPLSSISSPSLSSLSLSSSSALTSSSFASSSSSREFHSPAGGLASSKPFIYETNDPSEKRNQITVGRRSVDLPGESSGSQHQAQTPPTSSSSSSSSTSGSSSMPSQFMLRSIRANRKYDVPQIECPASEEGMERFACPTADNRGRYRCIDDHVLCDGFYDCPSGEDEDIKACMFYKTTRAHLDVLADAILRWARGR